MLDLITIHKAAEFWGPDAHEDDVFALPVVAAALGVGRNSMKALPIQRLTVEKRGAYRKGDVIRFLESGESAPLMDELRAKYKNANAGAVERAKREYFEARWIASLQAEAADLNEWLNGAEWPEDDETSRLLADYWRVAKNLSDAGRKAPKAPDGAWWLVEDHELRDKAHREARIAYLRREIQRIKSDLHAFVFDQAEWFCSEAEVIEQKKRFVDELEQELEKITS